MSELDNFVTFWNNHYIRKKSGIEAPSGIPIDMVVVASRWLDWEGNLGLYGTDYEV